MESPENEFKRIYVPRDEEFEEAKQGALDVGKLKGILRHIIPTLTIIASRDSNVFKGYVDTNCLYSTDMSLPKILNKVQEFLKFDPPKLISGKWQASVIRSHYFIIIGVRERNHGCV